jgi:hypothetical protein
LIYGVPNLVYYTIQVSEITTSNELIVDQHIQSVESLRKNNRSIPIRLAVWGGKLRTNHRRHLENLDVHISYLGDYKRRLQRYAPASWATIIGQHQGAARWLALSELLTPRFDRVLYLDNDTFVLRDIEEVFARFPRGDVCAREEPSTGRSLIPYDSSYIDESAIRALQRSEKISAIIPFNTGVVLLNSRVAQWLSRNLDLFLRYFVRFTISLAARRPNRSDESFVVAARRLSLSAKNIDANALVYPSRNQWIVDQFALWFTLATSPFKVRLLPASSVLQANEFVQIGRKFQTPCLVHYYSGNTRKFRRWLRLSSRTKPFRK